MTWTKTTSTFYITNVKYNSRTCTKVHPLFHSNKCLPSPELSSSSLTTTKNEDYLQIMKLYPVNNMNKHIPDNDYDYDDEDIF